MPRPRLQLVGAGLVLVGLVVAGVALAGLIDGDDEPTSGRGAAAIGPALAAATPARDPFPGLTQTQVVVADHRLDVVLADTDGERGEGLRQRDSLEPYDGMLFVYSAPVESRFTMSTVPVALDIAFYDARGHVVSRLRMAPCPGSESACPVYAPEGPFVYALETLAGTLPHGRLR
jgi:hypothetical protein